MRSRSLYAKNFCCFMAKKNKVLYYTQDIHMQGIEKSIMLDGFFLFFAPHSHFMRKSFLTNLYAIFEIFQNFFLNILK